MKTSPEIRRANRLLLLGLIAFAVALALIVYFWMRARISANGGVIDPVGWMRLESAPRLEFDPSSVTPV